MRANIQPVRRMLRQAAHPHLQAYSEASSEKPTRRTGWRSRASGAATEQQKPTECGEQLTEQEHAPAAEVEREGKGKPGGGFGALSAAASRSALDDEDADDAEAKLLNVGRSAD